MRVGRLGLGHLERARHLFVDGELRLLGVDGKLAGKQVLLVQVAERDVGVGDGRLRATLVVADRARVGPGARRSYLECASAVHPRDAASTGADLGQVDGGHPQDVAGTLQEAMSHGHPAADFVLGSPEQLTVFDDGRLGRRAAHVKGHDVRNTQAFSELEGAHDAGGRAGLDAEHRLVRGQLNRSEAAVGLHDRQRHRHAHLASLGAQPG